MIIEDGIGTGYKAKVSSENHLTVDATVRSAAHHVNHHEGECYSMTFSQAQAAGTALAGVVYMKNTSETDLVISQLSLYLSTSDDVISIQVGGTVTAATVNTPLNMHRGSGKTADGDFYTDDGDTLAETGFTTIMRLHLKGDTTSEHFEMPSDLILQKNQTFLLQLTTAQANTIGGYIIFYYHGED